MARRKRASGFEGLKFSKAKQVRCTAEEFRDMVQTESVLQGQCEELLEHYGFVKPGTISDDRADYGNLRGIYFHVPNEVFKAERTIVNDNLKNIPDLVILKYDGKYWAPELKSKSGELMQGQRAVRKIIPVSVFKSFELFERELIKFVLGEPKE